MEKSFGERLSEEPELRDWVKEGRRLWLRLGELRSKLTDEEWREMEEIENKLKKPYFGGDFKK